MIYTYSPQSPASTVAKFLHRDHCPSYTHLEVYHMWHIWIYRSVEYKRFLMITCNLFQGQTSELYQTCKEPRSAWPCSWSSWHPRTSWTLGWTSRDAPDPQHMPGLSGRSWYCPCCGWSGNVCQQWYPKAKSSGTLTKIKYREFHCVVIIRSPWWRKCI